MPDHTEFSRAWRGCGAYATGSYAKIGASHRSTSGTLMRLRAAYESIWSLPICPTAKYDEHLFAKYSPAACHTHATQSEAARSRAGVRETLPCSGRPPPSTDSLAGPAPDVPQGRNRTHTQVSVPPRATACRLVCTERSARGACRALGPPSAAPARVCDAQRAPDRRYGSANANAVRSGEGPIGSVGCARRDAT